MLFLLCFLFLKITSMPHYVCIYIYIYIYMHTVSVNWIIFDSGTIVCYHFLKIILRLNDHIDIHVYIYVYLCIYPLQWRHNECDGISNHQPHDYSLNRLFRHRSKKISKLCLTGLCAGNSLVTGEFPAQRASNVEYVSIWWCHHGTGSSVIQVMVLAACSVPSDYLYQC